MLGCEGEENTFTENAINDEIFMFQRKHVVFHDLRKGLTMDETANETKEKEGVPVTKVWGLIKLAVVIVGVFWVVNLISYLIVSILSTTNSYNTIVMSIIKIIIRIVGYKKEIDLDLIMSESAHIIDAMMIMPFLIYIQGRKRKSTVKAWGFNGPKREIINITISLIGTFAVFYVYEYVNYYLRGTWKDPFSGSFDIVLFLALIPFCVTSEVTQEVAFRGMFQAEVMDKLGRLRGIIIASLIFALMHLTRIFYYVADLYFENWYINFNRTIPGVQTPLILNWTSILEGHAYYLFSIFLYGLLWGYLYSRNRNLASPIAGHIFINTLATMFQG